MCTLYMYRKYTENKVDKYIPELEWTCACGILYSHYSVAISSGIYPLNLHIMEFSNCIFCNLAAWWTCEMLERIAREKFNA